MSTPYRQPEREPVAPTPETVTVSMSRRNTRFFLALLVVLPSTMMLTLVLNEAGRIACSRRTETCEVRTGLAGLGATRTFALGDVLGAEVETQEGRARAGGAATEPTVLYRLVLTTTSGHVPLTGWDNVEEPKYAAAGRVNVYLGSATRDLDVVLGSSAPFWTLALFGALACASWMNGRRRVVVSPGENLFVLEEGRWFKKRRREIELTRVKSATAENPGVMIQFDDGSEESLDAADLSLREREWVAGRIGDALRGLTPR